ncbi:2-C-methyl-D-erythritol 4-phosphate cytidylyltransferase [bacterium]|nr:2-C-methyl-D-erythritol 4-phosphate cytidylyltransferase [bacterium]
MKISVIITAGGTSSRYGSNKLLEVVNGKTVLEHTVDVFLKRDDVSEIIIPAHKDLIPLLNFKSEKIRVIEGGRVRQESVYFGLLNCSKPDFVMIHDGARPLIKQKDIDLCLQKALETGAAIVGAKVVDTMKTVDETGKIVSTIPRDFLYSVQTPQIFRYDLILSAHEKLKGQSFTDDALLLEQLNIPVYITEGDRSNIKITHKSDLELIKNYIKKGEL